MPQAAALAVANDPRVDFVEEDAEVFSSTSESLAEINLNSSPPVYGRWSLDRLGATGRVWDGTTYWGNKTYAHQTDGSGVYIYLIDTGINRTHSEFTNARVKDGVQFSDDPAGPNQPYAPCGIGATRYESGSNVPHGTGTASIAGGSTVGVASNAYLVPIKIFQCDGIAKLSWLCLGMDWIVGPSNPNRYDAFGNPTPGVVSISFYYDPATWTVANTDTTEGAFGQATQDVIRGCPLGQAPCPTKRGLTVIASANNQGEDGRACQQVPSKLSYNGMKDSSNTYYLYGYQEYRVISVGGTDEQDRIWKCSNFSGETCPDPGSNYGQCVDIYAPAHMIRAAAMRLPTPDSSYREAGMSGTSFAAPYVAGIAARILQSSPSLTPAQVWSQIQAKAQTVNGILIAHIGPTE